MKSKKKQIYKEAPQENKITSKKMFVIVDNKHKLVTHKDGHILIFHRLRDANVWLYRNTKEDRSWRAIKTTVDIIKPLFGCS